MPSAPNSTPPVADLGTLLRSLSPVQHPGVYAFTSVFFLLIAVVLTGLGQWYQRRFPKG